MAAILSIMHDDAPGLVRRSVDSIAERYPSPDPNDPFAPLWKLRSRASSGFNGPPTGVPKDNQLAKRPSESFIHFIPSPLQSNGLVNVAAGSPETKKRGHYRPRSQSASFPSSTTMAFSTPASLTTPWPHLPYATSPLVHVLDCDSSSSDMDESVSSNEGVAHPHLLAIRPSSGQKRLGRIFKSKNSTPHPNDKAPMNGERSSLSITTPLVSALLWDPSERKYAPIESKSTCKSASPIYPVKVQAHASDANINPPLTSLKDANLTPVSMSSPVSVAPPRRRRAASITNPSPVAPSLTARSSSTATPRPDILGETSQCTDASFCHLIGPLLHTKVPEWAIPSVAQLTNAASLPIITESGQSIAFGSLFAFERTIVIFIRHFWCPLCQDYMSSLMSAVSPELLQTRGALRDEVQIAVIGNGSHAFIAKYRKIFGMPYHVYTDPTLAVYEALGMSRGGKSSKELRLHHEEHLYAAGEVPEEQRSGEMGKYVKRKLIPGIALVVGRAVKFGMPVWENGGDVRQLGGEFIFGPGLTCSYAHRMQSTKGHAPIDHILRAASIFTPSSEPEKRTGTTADEILTLSSSQQLPLIQSTPKIIPSGRRISWTSGVDRKSPPVLDIQQQEWMENRSMLLTQIKERKNIRRRVIGGDDISCIPSEYLDACEGNTSALVPEVADEGDNNEK